MMAIWVLAVVLAGPDTIGLNIDSIL